MASVLRMRRQEQLWTAVSSLLGPDSMIEPQFMERVSLVIKDPAEYRVSSMESKLCGYSECYLTSSRVLPG